MNQDNSDIPLKLACFSEELIGVETDERLFQFILDGVSTIIGCDQASLMVFNSQQRKLELMKVRGFSAANIQEPRLEYTQNFSKWIYEGGEVFALTHDRQTKYLILFDQQESKYFNCELRIPLSSNLDKICLLNIGKKSTGTDYTQSDITIMQILVNLSRLAIDKLLFLNKERQLETNRPPIEVIRKTSPNIQIKKRVEQVRIIGDSDAIHHIHQLIERIASKDVSVLITGESGTGKDLVARSIHEQSYRCDNPFVAMNCAALPENLVESELFGHEKGAFTGAHTQKKGKFEYANSGTLFLDEIGDMSLSTQAKLLRVLEDGSYQRTGGNTTLKADVRIIAATNKDITEEILQGNFREDLYYRINVVQIAIPPLRDRIPDIQVLAQYFFEKFNAFYNKGIRTISDVAMKSLLEYEFPGNIRELQNIIERAVI
ncbi:MAG: sigma-54 dependent transcriptional regulator, partial [bacterium]|nr:sigma-54 dependent transcriptional regulator [bacterium]